MCLLPVRRELAEHCASGTPAPFWQPQQAGLRPLDQDPRSCHIKISCTHGPTGQDCQEPPEHYSSGSRRIRRNGKKEGRKEGRSGLKWKRETETNVDNIKKHSLDLANKIISV